jgi:glycerol-3-phosphate acyltransferase PlsY
MVTSIAVVVASYAIGSVPVAWIAGRLRGGVDLRELGSGNVGASNVWQSVSKALVIPVGLLQVGQGLAGIELASLVGASTAVQVLCGLAAIVAHDWNPWLRFRGGRGVGPAIGFMLGLATFDALPAFIVIAVVSVPFGQSPLGVGIGLVAAPVAAYAGGENVAVVGGCAAMTALVLAKRLLANAPPEPGIAGVRWNRLLFDRDIRDRDVWVRRGLDRTDRHLAR